MTIDADILAALSGLIVAFVALYQARKSARKDELNYLSNELDKERKEREEDRAEYEREREKDRRRIEVIERDKIDLKRENDLLRQRIDLQDKVISSWEQAQNRLIAEMRQQISQQNRQKIEDLQTTLDNVSRKLNQLEIENSTMREAMKQIAPQLPQTRPLSPAGLE